MTVIEFYNRLSELYPPSLSSSWDNDGLMCCADGNAEIKKVLVSLDATEAAIAYAIEGGFDLLLTHHPLIFKGLKALNEFDVVGRRVLHAMKAGLSVISLHTRLDAGEGGVNDVLASMLGLSNVTPFGDCDNPTLARIGTTEIANAKDFAEMIKKSTGVPSVSAHVCRPVSRVAVVGGSGGDLIAAARSAGADTLVTGECGYNRGLDAGDDSFNVFVAGHYFTEMPVCERLSSLAKEIADADAEIFRDVPEIYY